MKIQDIAFFLVLGVLLFKRDPKFFAIAGIISLILAIPLFSLWIFFTAERLTWYAAAFFLVAIIFYILQLQKSKTFKIPPILLDALWNRLHIVPIEWFIGDVDVFISSDWTQPPTKKAKKATILYDLIVHKYPNETDKKIVDTQRRRLTWVKKECDVVFCISESTKKDAMEILGIEKRKLKV